MKISKKEAKKMYQDQHVYVMNVLGRNSKSFEEWLQDVDLEIKD